jgi:hypothetical protein
MPLLESSFASNGEAWAAFWACVAVASLSVMGGGWWLVKTRLPASVAGAPEAMRLERAALRSLEAD